MAEQVDPARTYVSFSAGKDSAVLAHAAHAAHPGIAILQMDSGCPFLWLEEERSEWIDYATAHGWNYHRFEWDKWGLHADTATDVETYQKRIHANMFQPIHDYAAANGLNGVLMGLRGQESQARRFTLGKHGQVYTRTDGTTRLCPLAKWTTDDVWAYTITNGLPWLRIYDAVGPDARNGLIGRTDGHRRMAYLRMYFPQAYRVARDVLGLMEAI
jgi:sulfate adenylyltransferase subunit 2